MRVGMLYPYEQEKFNAERKAGKPVTIGLDPQSILDDINVLEAQTRYDGLAVLASIKETLLTLTGKIGPVEEAEAEEVKV